MESLRKMILEAYPEFYKELDETLKLFCREIKEELRKEGHVVIGVTGYPGVGKSNDVAIISSEIDHNYSFDKNICFIPTSKEIEEKYLSLPMYSVLHIDEASRGLHKHKWHDKVQQKINELYDTEREGHFLSTILIMPRFQNFTENFRNFMIKYWIHIPMKGLAIFYKKDEDKDARDPWHIDENYKTKMKKWKGKRVFERALGDVVRMEQLTDCYWFYCKIPAIPKEIWEKYQELKVQSRIRSGDIEAPESYREKIDKEKMNRWQRIVELKKQGIKNEEIGAVLGVSAETVRRNLRSIEAYLKMSDSLKPHPTEDYTNISNQYGGVKKLENKGEVEQSAKRGTQT